MKKAISISLCLILMLATLILPASAYTAELVSPPDKITFYEGPDWFYNNSQIVTKSDFDLTGTVVKYNGNDISFHVFPWGGNMIAVPSDGKWKAGKNKVKIVLDDFDDAYVESELNLVTIKKIELEKAPNKTELVHGVDWNYDLSGNIKLNHYSPAGAKIKLTFNDGTSTVISYEDGGIDWAVPGDVDDFVMGKNNLVLTYYGRSVPFEICFVMENITSAVVKNKPSRINYDFKDHWSYSGGKITPDYDLNGLKVAVTYSNGKTETIAYSTDSSRFKLEAPSTITLGTNKIKAKIDGATTVEFEIFIRGCGDVDFNGKVNSNDALNVLQYSVSLIKFNLVKIRYADVNDDDKVNSSDALAILQKSVGSIDYFKAELV